MKRLLAACFMLLVALGSSQATERYKIVYSTKTDSPAYSIKGSQRYEICADTASAPVVTISSWTVNFGGLLLTNSTAPYANNSDMLDGEHGAAFHNPANLTAGTCPATVVFTSAGVNSIYPGAVQSNASSNPYRIFASSAGYTSMSDFTLAQAAPTFVSSFGFGGEVGDCVIRGKYAYATSIYYNGGLYILDISNPANIKQVGYTSENQGDAKASRVAIKGKNAYVTTENISRGILVYDITNPASIVFKTSISSGTGGGDLVISGNYLFYTGMYYTGGIYQNGVLRVFDISQPDSLTEIADYQLGKGVTNSMIVDNKYAYISMGKTSTPDYGWSHLTRLNVQDPYNIILSTEIATNVAYLGEVSGGKLYTSAFSPNSINIYDVSYSSSIALISQTTIDTAYGVALGNPIVRGKTLWLPGCGYQLYSYDISYSTSLVQTSTQTVVARTFGYKLATDGEYLYSFRDGNNSALNVFKMNGLDAPAINVGSIKAGSANIEQELNVQKDAHIGGSLDVAETLNVRSNIYGSSITARTFYGSGSNLTAITPANVSTGSLPLGVTSQYSIAADTLDGQHGSYYLPVSTITGATQASPVQTWVTSATYAVNGGSGGTGSGDSIKKSYTQTAHGFSLGKAVYYNGSQWLMAKADSVATADALGIVDAVGIDTFSITMQGYLNTGNGVAWTAGSVYYLSATSSGTLTTTEPITYGYVSKPLLFALGTSSGIVVNMRGVVVTQAGVYDGVPVGGFIWYSTTTAPSDFLYCNGSTVSRTTYSALFANIGTRYGTGDGSTTFNLPDMRGLFPRGLDDGKGIDKGGENRVAGSTETFALQGHFHQSWRYATAFTGGGSADGDDAGGAINTSVTSSRSREPITGNNGTVMISSETRPSNMALCLMVKYRVNISTQGGILDATNTWTAPQTFTSTITASEVQTTYGFFHERGDPATYDISPSSFTTDGANHDLSFAHIVPVGTKAIVLSINIVDDSASSQIAFYKNGWVNGYNAIVALVLVANANNRYCLTIPLDENRICEYNATNTTFSNIYGTVVGWFK